MDRWASCRSTPRRTWSCPTNDATYSYDLNGNQTSRSQGGVLTGFLYDVRDQLVEVQTDGTLLESYGFSYDGLRNRKSGPGGLFRFVYDQRSLLLQTDLAGLTVSRYEWGPDRLLSLDHATEGRQFYLFDALGSVVNLSKPDGTLQARYRWDAWGNLRSSAGSSSNLFGFTGHQRDEETGLYYFGARFYDPELGRFLTEDPFGGEAMTSPSLHRYLYAYANPTVYWDPTGREAEESDELPEFLRTSEVRVDSKGRLYTSGSGSRSAATGQAAANEEAPEPEESWFDKATTWLRETSEGAIEAVFELPQKVREFGESFDEAQAHRRTTKDVLAGRNNVDPLRAAGRAGADALELAPAAAEDALTVQGFVGLGRAGVAKGRGLLARARKKADEFAEATKRKGREGLRFLSDRWRRFKGRIQAVDPPVPGRRAAAVAKGSTRSQALLKRDFETLAPNRGFLGGFTTKETLQPGTVIDRFGGRRGRFTSPEGTPFSARGLPPENARLPYERFEVVKPLEVDSGIVDYAFGGGGGIQYELPVGVQDLIDADILRAVN